MVDMKFAEDALKAHNEYRSRHQAPPLKHNKDISIIAQRWADNMARTGTFQHSNDRNYRGDKLGENIAMKWTSGGGDYNGRLGNEHINQSIVELIRQLVNQMIHCSIGLTTNQTRIFSVIRKLKFKKRRLQSVFFIIICPT